MSAIRYLLAATVVIVAATPATTRADEQEQAPVEIVLSPMPAPDPPLAYRLWPEVVDRIPGNAAVYYGKIKAENNSLFGDAELRDKVDEWRHEPLESLRDEGATVPGFTDWTDTPLYYLDQGARCAYCDWQLPIGREPFFTILLPELQESRGFARWLTAAARVDVAHDRFAEAAKKLQVNYALGRNVAHSETIVGGLVGIAIAQVGNEQLQTFIQQPEAPNMYWALAALPRPLVDMRLAVHTEASAIEIMFPGLRDCISKDMTPDEARALFFKVWAETAILADNLPRPANNFVLVLANLPAYSVAKARLIKSGLPAQRVEAMPVAQALLADAYLIHRRSEDLNVAAFELPYSTSQIVFEQAERNFKESNAQGWTPMVQILAAIRPWMQGIRIAQVRLERELAVLRLLEAVRMHAAANEGKLPEALSDITVVPVPSDPVTDQPFEWSVSDGAARLTGPDLRNSVVNYRIRMRAAAESHGHEAQ
ncbi:MAG: hypothetical protein CMJ58_05080 [Planctomycetaceae bacterium]|nr:hypothetical protein [Planctomycetaceae bacterium]